MHELSLCQSAVEIIQRQVFVDDAHGKSDVYQHPLAQQIGRVTFTNQGDCVSIPAIR